MTIAWAVGIHAATVALALAVLVPVLWRRSLFNVRSAGFWAWWGILLYLVLPPALALLTGDMSDYDLTLGIAGGPDRAFWITGVTLAGIAAFFLAYLRAGPGSPRSGPATAMTAPQILVMAGTIAIGLWSLAVYRSGLLSDGGVAMSAGRFTGTTTGYQYTAHLFLFFPVALLLLRDSAQLRALGLALAAAYVTLGSLDPNSRYLQVSMILLVAVAGVVRSGRRWPNPYLIVGAAALAAALGIRGHAQFTSFGDFLTTIAAVPGGLAGQFTGENANLVSNWYLQSWLDDTQVGYNYGLQLLNYLLTGFLPDRLFPDKYFLIDWLRAQEPVVTNPVILRRMQGQSPGFIGEFYSDGGMAGVIVLSVCWGWLSRKIDGMVQAGRSTPVRALGMAWLSLLWMVWGRGDFWTVTVYGTIAIPALAYWLVSPHHRPALGARRLPLNAPGRQEA